MKLKAQIYCAAGLLVLLAAGCASQRGTEMPQSDADNICINVSRINGFTPLSDRELLVTADVNEYYLFTVDAYCPGLRYTNSLAVVDTLNRICSNGFGRIVFDDQSYSSQSCSVSNIERLASRDEVRETVKARVEMRRQQ